MAKRSIKQSMVHPQCCCCCTIRCEEKRYGVGVLASLLFFAREKLMHGSYSFRICIESKRCRCARPDSFNFIPFHSVCHPRNRTSLHCQLFFSIFFSSSILGSKLSMHRRAGILSSRSSLCFCKPY